MLRSKHPWVIMGAYSAEEQLVSDPRAAPRRSGFKPWHKFPSTVFLLLLLLVLAFSPPLWPRTIGSGAQKPIERCAIRRLHDDLSFLDGTKAISTSEFLDRRVRLARALVASDVDAFVLEPGYTFQ